jgi:electron transfer flavoprotein alpha/beta subunit
MNMLVCLKQVPDTQQVKIDPEKGTLIRKGVPAITNPFDESALEFALEIKDKLGGCITVLTMGIPDSECMLRDAMAIGADCGILLTDAGFAGADTLATSYTLSRAIQKIGDFDLLVFGKQAIDGDTAQVGPEVAGHLDIPVITFVMGAQQVTEHMIVVERMLDNGREIVRSEYPVVLTVVKADKRLRMPTLDGIVSSFDLRVQKLRLPDIGADPQRCGLKGSPTRVKKIFTPKQHSRVCFIEGSTEEKAKEFIQILQEQRTLS